METRKIEILSFRTTTKEKQIIKNYLKEKGIKNFSKFMIDLLDKEIKQTKQTGFF